MRAESVSRLCDAMIQRHGRLAPASCVARCVEQEVERLRAAQVWGVRRVLVLVAASLVVVCASPRESRAQDRPSEEGAMVLASEGEEGRAAQGAERAREYEEGLKKYKKRGTWVGGALATPGALFLGFWSGVSIAWVGVALKRPGSQDGDALILGASLGVGLGVTASGIVVGSLLGRSVGGDIWRREHGPQREVEQRQQSPGDGSLQWIIAPSRGGVVGSVGFSF